MNLTSAGPGGSTSSSSSSDLLLRELNARGWHFRDAGKIQGLFTTHLSTPHSLTTLVDSVESQLLNLDLRSIGGKCLPEPSLLRKTSHLQPPIVLQICSTRDISRSRIDDATGNSGNKRLLRLKLTDGHSEITAVEYSRIPSISDDISPGTKVRLQRKVDVYSGILCLKKDVITILGGVVESLYEEWELERKYLDVPRNTLRFSKENVSSGPPPFEKLQVGVTALRTGPASYASTSKGTQCSTDPPGFSGSSSSDHRQHTAARGDSSKPSHVVQPPNKPIAAINSVADNAKLLHNAGEDEGKPTCSTARPKVSASVPVQNQAAAQKLLQKMSHPNFDKRNPRNQRHRGKFKEEEESVITLDEWERRKAGNDAAMTHEHSNFSQDEDLARQLQEQFYLEDMHGQKGPHATEATDIKMSMFNFERDEVILEVGGGDGEGEEEGDPEGDFATDDCTVCLVCFDKDSSRLLTCLK